METLPWYASLVFPAICVVFMIGVVLSIVLLRRLIAQVAEAAEFVESMSAPRALQSRRASPMAGRLVPVMQPVQPVRMLAGRF